MRVLGIDWGMKRIGVAVGESDFGIATARPLIMASGSLRKDAQAILSIKNSEGAEAIVVGIPLRHDDQEGEVAKVSRKLVELLVGLGEQVFLVDESMTSVTAEQRLIDEGVRAAKRKEMRDGRSATVILERFFSEQSKT